MSGARYVAKRAARDCKAQVYDRAKSRFIPGTDYDYFHETATVAELMNKQDAARAA